MTTGCRIAIPPSSTPTFPPTEDLLFSGYTDDASGTVFLANTGRAVEAVATVIPFAFDAPRRIYSMTVNVPTALVNTNETLDVTLVTMANGNGAPTPIPNFSVPYAQTGTPPDSGIVTLTPDSPFVLATDQALAVQVSRGSGDTNPRSVAVTVKVGRTSP